MKMSGKTMIRLLTVANILMAIILTVLVYDTWFA